MVGWIQGEEWKFIQKYPKENISCGVGKNRGKFARWSSNFALWFEVCEIPTLWTEEFAPWFPSCENFAQPDAVVFRRSYLSHFSSKSYMVWTVGFLTFWALKWYIECKKMDFGKCSKSAMKDCSCVPYFHPLFSSSPLFLPCILWTTKAKDYEAP